MTLDLNKLHSAPQPLLKRIDVTYRVAYAEATPSRIQLAQAIAAKERGLVVVAHVYPHTGENFAIVHARVYADEAIANAVEQQKLLAKQKPAVAAPAEA